MKRNSILICLLFAITATTFNAAKAQVNTSDSLALVDFYNSTGGPNWIDHTNWLTANPVSTWVGIRITGSRVVNIHFRLNNLTGTLPASIGNLTNLAYLSLLANQLTGTIPAEIGNLTDLTYLDFSQNQLTGIIPASIGNLVNLKNLELYNNQLTGTIPAEIGNLINLKDLELERNQLTGTIPAEIGNLTNLTGLYLSENGLTGIIPATLGNLTNLTGLDLNINQLSGSIPSEIGKLSNLTFINLNNNQLSGTVPASLQKLTKLTYFNLSYNQLSAFGHVKSFIITDSNVVGYMVENLFNFDGLEVIAKKFRNISYAPQNTILTIHQSGNVLSVNAGGTLSKNTYYWHRAGSTDSSIITGDSTFSPAQSGMYYARVTNAIVTQRKYYNRDLVLTTDTISYTMPLAQAQNNIANIAAVKTITNHFSIYPNPAKDIIHIQTNGNATIIFTNSAGKILLSKSINNSGEINVSSYTNGVYYIQNKTTGETQKIIVIH